MWDQRRAARADHPLRDARRPVRDPRSAAGSERPGGRRRSAARSTRSSRRSTTRGSRSATRGPAATASRTSRRRASSPASTPAPTSPAACTRRPPTRCCARSAASTQTITKREQDILNPQNINVLRVLPGTRQPRLGRARAHVGRVMALRPRAPAVPHDRGVDRRGHAVGGLRAQRRAAVGPRAPVGHAVPVHAVAHRRAAGVDRRRGVLRRLRPLDDDARTTSTTAGSSARSASRPVKPAEFVIFRIQQKTLDDRDHLAIGGATRHATNPDATSPTRLTTSSSSSTA